MTLVKRDFLKRLRSACLQRDVEWDPHGKLDLMFKTTELGGEVGEVLNVAKKLQREILGLPGSRDTHKHLAEELADVLICVDRIAMQFDIDLEEATTSKFNETSMKNGLLTVII